MYRDSKETKSHYRLTHLLASCEPEENSAVFLFVYFSRLPITRTFKGNRKKVRVIGSSKKIAKSNVKNSFYCTVNILITFNCTNVK